MSTDRNMEHRRVLEPNLFDQDLVTATQCDHPRTTNVLLLLDQRPPRGALAIDLASAADLDVVQASPADETLGVGRAAGVLVDWEHLQCRAGVEAKVDATGRMKRPGQKLPRGNFNHASTLARG